jgi:hypothetical protein
MAIRSLGQILLVPFVIVLTLLLLSPRGKRISKTLHQDLHASSPRLRRARPHPAHLAPSITDNEIFEACDAANRTNNSRRFVLLKDTMSLPGDVDEFGDPSEYPSLVSIVKKLTNDGILVPPGRNGTAVNFGARDGVGSGGNTDPTWPLFKDLGFGGIAVEASHIHAPALANNFLGLSAKSVLGMVSPQNVLHMIRTFGIAEVDVLKMDIDSWDCEVLPVVLGEPKLSPKLVLVEYNTKFPPPIKMNLATRPQHLFRSCARYHIYECSLQYMNDHVMAPAGYALAQLDWQNALYVHKNITSHLGIPEDGIDVASAYHRGYANRANRTRNLPWNHDIDHLLLPDKPSDAMRHAFKYIREGYHLQDGAVQIGCGDKMQLMQYHMSPSIAPGDRVGDC